VTAEVSRRRFLKMAAVTTAVAATTAACGDRAASVKQFIHTRLHEMKPDEVKEFCAQIEKDCKQRFDRDVHVASDGPIAGVIFGYGLDLSRCNGNRRCVEACVGENNQSRGSPE
jgi:hypothetical protein